MKAVCGAAFMLFAVAPLPVWAEQLTVALDGARVLQLEKPVSVIVVGNPIIADVTVDSPTRLRLTGLAPGKTNLLVFDRSGEPVADFNLEVVGARAVVTVGQGPRTGETTRIEGKEATETAQNDTRHGG